MKINPIIKKMVDSEPEPAVVVVKQKPVLEEKSEAHSVHEHDHPALYPSDSQYQALLKILKDRSTPVYNKIVGLN